MPDWARRFLRDYHNSFHGGAPYSWLELANEIPEMEAGFSLYKDEMGFNARTPGYEAKFWAWLKLNYPDKLKSFDEFDSMRAMIRKLQKLGVWEDSV